MTFKIIGILLVVCSGVYMGYYTKKRYSDHEHFLENTMTALSTMQTYMDFRADCLADIFRKIADLPLGVVAEVFLAAAELSNGAAPAKSLYESFALMAHRLNFGREELAALKRWCAMLGKGDAIAERAQIEEVLSTLASLKEVAHNRLQKEGKLAESFCVMASVLLVILFL